MTANNHFLRGTGIALVTPFNQDGSIDTLSLTKLIEHCNQPEIDYLVVLGTTGETVTLDEREKALVTETIATANDGRKPLVIGIGGNDTRKVSAEIKAADSGIFSAVLSASPAYNKPTQAGIRAHYAELANASPLPIIIYNVPGRTASNILPQTTLQIAADNPNVIGIKEAAGNLDQNAELINGRPEGFLVISGDDNLAFPHYCLGGDGIISVLAQAVPSMFGSMFNNVQAGDYRVACKTFLSLGQLTKLCFAEGNPGGIKYMLTKMKVIQNHLRLPLVPISDQLQLAIDRELKALNL